MTDVFESGLNYSNTCKGASLEAINSTELTWKPQHDI
jgi:hypothetical protein